MNTTASTVTPISENPKQPQQRQTAKEMIAANVKCLIEQPLRRPTNPARAGFPQSLSVTTANSTAMPCATRRCVSSLA